MGARWHQGRGNPGAVLWDVGALWASTGMGWRGRWKHAEEVQPKGHPLSMGQRPAALRQLHATCLKRGKPAEKARTRSWGMPWEGSSRQRVTAKQDAWEKSKDMHGGLDLTT